MPRRSENGRSSREIMGQPRFEPAVQTKVAALDPASVVSGGFLAILSHEMRTPLHGIIGLADLLLQRLPGSLTSEQEDDIRAIQTSAEHLLSLVDDVRTLAKIETGRVEVGSEPVDCRSLVQTIVTTLQPAAEKKALSLQAAGPADPCIVWTDRRALNQILLNLVDNAVKFTDHGQVSVTLKQHSVNGSVFADIEVRDTGPGIQPEHQERIFDAFSRIVPPGKPRCEGTGLGLYISQKLAHLLGGTIAVQSVVGQGSTFTLSVPVGAAEAAPR